MRPDQLYLTDILTATADIREFLAGIDRGAFLRSKLLQSAVLQKLIVIGEAAARLSPELREHHPEVEWPDIIGFRNIAVHAYFSIEWPVVWLTATLSVPELREKITAIFPDEST